MTTLRYPLAFFAAALVPSLLISVPNALSNLSMGDEYAMIRTWKVAVIAFSVAGAHVLFLGLPAFLLTVGAKAFAWWSAMGLGLVLGALPLAVFSWPLSYGPGASSSHWEDGRMVETLIDGVPTAAGWWSYAASVAGMGTLGAVGGLSFWLVLHALRPNPSFKRTPDGAA